MARKWVPFESNSHVQEKNRSQEKIALIGKIAVYERGHNPSGNVDVTGKISTPNFNAI